MNNVMQTASRIALIATLSATPALVAAQTATQENETQQQVETDSTTAAAQTDNAASDTETTADAAKQTDTETDTVAESDSGATTETTADAAASEQSDGTATTGGTASADAGMDDEASTDATADAGATVPADSESADSGAMVTTNTDTAQTGGEMTTDTAQSDGTMTTDPDAVAVDGTNTEVASDDAMTKPVEGQIRMQSENTILAEDLIGSSVYSENGESIGDINNLIVSLDGMVEGVVIGVGGFLGLGEKDVAIEMASLAVSTDDNQNTRLMTSATKEDLEAAEEFVTVNQQRAAAPASTDTMTTTTPTASD